MIEIIHRISPQNIAKLRADLAELDSYLQADVSNYAKGRMRFWLNYEWQLRDKQFIIAPKCPERLWNYCVAVCGKAGFTPDLGLIAKGKTGIGLHRDDSYAAFKAVSVQIGTADWTYDQQYPGYSWVPEEKKLASDPQTYRLEDCVVAFNCKNQHAAVPLSSDRYSINLWRVSDKFQTQFRAVR